MVTLRPRRLLRLIPIIHSIYLLGGGVSMAALSVEHLKVMAALTVEHANASSDGGPYGRAPKGPYQSST